MGLLRRIRIGYEILMSFFFNHLKIAGILDSFISRALRIDFRRHDMKQGCKNYGATGIFTISCACSCTHNRGDNRNGSKAHPFTIDPVT
ncbi:hypothetical protein CEXT_365451 [Caerostris extrusa]|uniref:Uncharacterized protein n=1 Tax=Caerostris extrusa TaxID=172846 RepID=A0AAV4PYP0_CAEEX|nr:hypothetical protein CEXT_365451 [Caerostris extrusa]